MVVIEVFSLILTVGSAIRNTGSRLTISGDENVVCLTTVHGHWTPPGSIGVMIA